MSDKTKKSPSKDLTGIIQYAKKMQDSGQTAEAPKGMIMEETPVEKISDFESLTDYATANPMPEPVFDDGTNEEPLSSHSESETNQNSVSEKEFAPSEFAESEFSTSNPDTNPA